MARPWKGYPGPFLDSLTYAGGETRRYPHSLPAFRSFKSLKFHPKVTFFVGENGSGKSTLLEAIAVSCGLNPEGGSANFKFATRESHSNLAESIDLQRVGGDPKDSYFLRAETFYNVATEVEKLKVGGSYGHQSLHEQSHGESFMALFVNRFQHNSLYLMDEPEAALSPKRQMQFITLLHDYVSTGCQFVIATHSPMIMAYPDATIYNFSDNGIEEVKYEETEHYVVTKGFLGNPKKSLKILMNTGDTEQD